MFLPSPVSGHTADVLVVGILFLITFGFIVFDTQLD